MTDAASRPDGAAQVGALPAQPPSSCEPTLQQIAERRTRALADALEEAIRSSPASSSRATVRARTQAAAKASG
ncbi:hypothetical protein AB4Z48_18970 [Cupriavidus sp. 2TAF22]|uniref:hypothetical protein n=1 Tax=unclassified Cupriavidus TaxID=2640874 RepID=UPI003F92458A